MEYLNEIEKKIKSQELPNILDIKNGINDPITEEVCEAFINQYIEKGFMEASVLNLKSDKPRGQDLIKINDKYFFDSFKEALNMIIYEFKKGNFTVINRINPLYRYEFVKNINLIEEFLKNDKNLVYDEKKFKDDEISIFLKKIFDDCYSALVMNQGGMANKDFLDCNNENEDFRFYINMPLNEDTSLFSRDYQILCQRFGVPFTMKLYKNAEENCKDVTIFYSTLEHLPIKISILRELIKKYPNMELGSPLVGCATIKGLPDIGICNNGIIYVLPNGSLRNKATYREMIDYLFNSIFCCFISNYILSSSKFSEETINKVKKFKEKEFEEKFRYLNIRGVSYYYYLLNEEDKKLVRDYMSELMKDPLKKKVVIDFFMKYLRIAYNINNGFSEDYEPNIAFDSWYVNKKLGEYEKNKGESNKRR